MPTLCDPIDVGVIANPDCRAALPKICRSIRRWTPPAGTARARKAMSIMQRRLGVISRHVASSAGLEITAN